jgi:inhibitor of cysteine peptidase
MEPACGITEKNAGTTVTLESGDTLVVRLKGNLSTGYSWESEKKDHKLLVMIGEPEFTPESKSIVGSAGVITLKFKAVAVGKERLKLIYHRTWEKNAAPLQTFEVTLVVK